MYLRVWWLVWTLRFCNDTYPIRFKKKAPNSALILSHFVVALNERFLHWLQGKQNVAAA